MRGNPLLRAGLLAALLCLTGLLVAAVVGRERAPLPSPPPPSMATDAPVSGTLVPTLLTITLSAPVGALSFTETSGRVLTIPIPSNDALTLFHPLDLAIPANGDPWQARLNLTWQDPAGHHFARFDFEPRKRATTTLLLDFPGNASDQPLSVAFASP